MIQRIQSLFLLLASGSFFSEFALPFASTPNKAKAFFSDMLYNVYDHPALMALAGIGGVLALVTIFLFKNRELQKRMGYLLIVLAILLVAVAFLLMMNAGIELNSSLKINDELGLYMPAVAIVMAVMANRFITKDIKIVKSMDRLR